MEFSNFGINIFLLNNAPSKARQLLVRNNFLRSNMHACKQAQLIHMLFVNHLRLNDFSCMVNVVGNVKNVSQLCSRGELMVTYS